MTRTHLRLLMRRLQGNPYDTTVKLLSLSVGFAVCLLIGLWIQDEMSYDDFHPNAEDTYRIALHYELPGRSNTFSLTPFPLARTLESEFPEVEQTTQVLRSSRMVRHGSQSFLENDFYLVRPSFLSMFSFPLVEGNPEKALIEPRSIVLTQTAVQKYFPEVDPMGQPLRIDGTTFTVTGIAADPPSNTHFDFDFLGHLKDVEGVGWRRNTVITYAQTRSGTDLDAFQSQLTSLIQNRKPAASRSGYDYDLYAQPISGIHLGTGLPEGVTLQSLNIPQTFGGTGDANNVLLFAALGIFILLIGCANFVNLATARTAERRKEVGVRKTLGAQQGQLSRQFIGESLVLCVLASGLALVFAYAALPLVNDIGGKALELGSLFTLQTTVGVLGLILIVGLLSGAYPALVLSRFGPASAFQEKTPNSGGFRLRQVLVVFQFVLSIALVGGTVVIYQQLDYLHTKNRGFDDEQVLLIDLHDELLKESAPPKTEVTGLPDVVSATRAFSVPSRQFSSTTYRPVSKGEEAETQLYATWGDYDYTSTLGIDVVRGRTFSRAHPSDSTAMIINEAAARALFGEADPIGKQVTPAGRDPYPRTVIGVMETVHFQSLQEEVAPMAIFFLEFPSYWPDPRVMAVRIQSDDLAQTVDHVREEWKSALPGAPFSYSFLSEAVDAQFRSTDRLASLFTVFAGVAILIAILGLFGLASYASEQRAREVSIRKVYGASSSGIVALLARRFSLLVGIAFIVSSIGGYVLMRHWLGTFAYHVTLSPLVFLGAGLLALAVAVGTVSAQAYKIAYSDPARILRNH